MRKTILLVILTSAFVIAVAGQKHPSEIDSRERKIERLIGEMGRNYSRMIQLNDAAAIEKTLADDYLLADEEGRVYTKQQDLATYKDRAASVKIESIEYLDQNVRLISADVAIDHSTIRFIGKRGTTPFDVTERCTTIWAKRGNEWKIVADHFSYVKPALATPLK
jgi:ketosteroid isomerase-like protein